MELETSPESKSSRWGGDVFLFHLSTRSTFVVGNYEIFHKPKTIKSLTKFLKLLIYENIHHVLSDECITFDFPLSVREPVNNRSARSSECGA
jgi:hypothetical protein